MFYIFQFNLESIFRNSYAFTHSMKIQNIKEKKQLNVLKLQTEVEHFSFCNLFQIYRLITNVQMVLMKQILAINLETRLHIFLLELPFGMFDYFDLIGKMNKRYFSVLDI